jgi:hypothetical protein
MGSNAIAVITLSTYGSQASKAIILMGPATCYAQHALPQ